MPAEDHYYRHAGSAMKDIVHRDNMTRAHRRISIGFEYETFDQVRKLAQKNNLSFAEQIRTFTEWGLEALES
jgi:hypothetical protein